MPLLRSFRLSIYLTLALACLCLGYAEGDLLPEAPYITALSIVLIAVAHRVEGRWSLSLQSANSVGVVLAVTLCCWVGFQFVRGSTGLLDVLPFPANLLPYLGPVLMILVPFKLFRPKNIGDFWAIQGVGLLAVTLGCAMANDLFFGALLFAYIVCFAWSLALFYLYREMQLENGPANSEGPESRWQLLFAASGWSVLIVTAGLVLFLLTPRPADRKWELSVVARAREIGLTDGAIDLNRTGSLESTSEMAFQVYAEDAAGNAKLDLDLNQRWRAASISHYEGGRWVRERNSGLRVIDRARLGFRPRPANEQDQDRRQRRNSLLPDFGPQTSYLTYTLLRNVGGANISTDPVMWRPNEPPPILVFLTRNGSVQQHEDGQFEWLSLPGSGRSGYCQAVASSSHADLGPPMRALPGHEEFLTWIAAQETRDRLRQWTSELLARLVRDGKLSPEAIRDVDPETRLPLEKHYQAIARALEGFLSRSGEFTYTLELNRKNKGIDPVEDFLFNTRSGHCQRFASALALMLRSQGIPTQLVVGFRGCETLGDGRYVVRQSHAHAWVEALIPHQGPADSFPPLPEELAATAPPIKAVQWLSLDPTPSGEPVGSNERSLTGWLERSRAWLETTFRNVILGNDAGAHEMVIESIRGAVEDFTDGLLSSRLNWQKGSVAFFVLLLAAWFRVPLRRRRLARAAWSASRETARQTPFHGRLMNLLARHGLTPRPGQTVREFTTAAADWLSTRNVADSDTPCLLADAYYRVRFGGHTLDEADRQSLNEALDRLETSLALISSPNLEASRKSPVSAG